MRVQEVVGRRIARAREMAGLSQAELAAEVREYLGKGWESKHPVSQAELGHRPLGAEQVLVFAIVLERPLAWFFFPFEEPVEIGDGNTISPSGLATALVTQSAVESDELASVAEAAWDLSKRLQALSLSASEAKIKADSDLSPEQLLQIIFGRDAAQASSEAAQFPRCPGPIRGSGPCVKFSFATGSPQRVPTRSPA